MTTSDDHLPTTDVETTDVQETADLWEPEVAASRDQGRVGRYFLLTISVLGIMLMLTASLFVWTLSKLNVFGEGETTITSTGLGGSFSEIAELSVEEYNFTNVGKYDEEGLKFFGLDVPFTGKNFLITYDGVVKAGIADASQIEVDINESTKIVRVSVPGVEVTETSIDPSSIVVYDQSMNPFNQHGIDDLAAFLAAEEANAEAKALEIGLLQRAEDRSEALIEAHIDSILDAAGMSNYTVVVEWETSVYPTS